MVQLHYGSQGTLAKTSDRADSKLPIRRCERQFVSVRAVLVQAKFEAQAFEQTARPARVACRSAADRDRVLTLWLAVEQRIKRDDAEDPRQRRPRFLCDVADGFETKILTGMVFLNFFQDSKQRARTATVAGDNLVDESPLPRVRPVLGHRGGHRNSLAEPHLNIISRETVGSISRRKISAVRLFT